MAAFPSTPVDGQYHEGFIYDEGEDLWYHAPKESTVYNIDSTYSTTDFPVGTPVALTSAAEAQPADKTAATTAAVVGLAHSTYAGHVVVQTGGLLTGVDPAVISADSVFPSVGQPVFLGDSATLIQDTNLINVEEYRTLVGYVRGDDTLAVVIGEAILISDSPVYWDAMPLGALTYKSVDFHPEGWIYPDGRELSRTTYAKLNELYADQGYPHGDGDGSTTFNIPDYSSSDPALMIKVRYADIKTETEQAEIDKLVYVYSQDTFPADPILGQEVWRTDLDAFFKYNGNAWIEI